MQKNIKKISISIVLIISLLEGGLRFVLGNFAQSALIEKSDNPELCLVLGKNKNLIYTGWWGKVEPTVMESNQFGSRETREDYPIGDKKRIIMLGDSFTYGQGVSQIDSLPTQVQQELPELDIWNFGVPGRDFFQFYADIDRLGKEKTDWILINIFANDFDREPGDCILSKTNERELQLMRNCYLCRLGLFSFSDNLKEYDQREREIQIVQHVQKIQNWGKENDVHIGFVFLTDQNTITQYSSGLSNVQQIIREQADNIIDVGDVFGNMAMQKQEFFIPKEEHLNPKGNHQLAIEYARQLRILLDSHR